MSQSIYGQNQVNLNFIYIKSQGCQVYQAKDISDTRFTIIVSPFMEWTSVLASVAHTLKLE